MEYSSKKIYFLSFFVSFLLILVSLFFSKIFPWGENSFLILDNEMQYLDFLAYYKDLFFSKNDFFYNFSLSGGAPFFDFASYYNLFSPLNVFILFCPDEFLQIFYQFLIMIKISLCALAFAYFLNHEFGCHKRNIFFALTYALCEHNIVYSTEMYVLLDGVIILPVALKGISDILKNKKNYTYIGAIVLSIICNGYSGYVNLLFSGLFFIYKLFINKFLNPIKTVKTFCYSSLLAVGLCSWLIIPVFDILSNSKNSFFDLKAVLTKIFIFGETPDFFEWLARFYTNNAQVMDFLSDKTPFLFIGIFSLILLITYFMNRNFSYKERIITGLVFLFIFCSFFINILFTIWCMGVENPWGSVFRFGYVYNFFAIYIAYISFSNLNLMQNNKILLSQVGIVFAIMTLFVFFKNYDFINNVVLFADLIFGILLLLFLFLIYKFPQKKILLLSVLVIGHLVNLTVNNDFVFKNIRTYALSKNVYKYTDNYLLMKRALNFIKNNDDTFYRIESNETFHKNKYWNRMTNLSSLHRYNSVASYSSSGNIKTADFYSKIGFPVANNTFIISYDSNMTNFPLSFMGSKYIISARNDYSYPYILIHSVSDDKQTFYIYQNDFALNAAFLVSDNILKYNIDDYSFESYQNSLMKTVASADFGDVYDYENISLGEKNDKIHFEKTIKITKNDNLYLILTPGSLNQSLTVNVVNSKNEIISSYNPFLFIFDEYIKFGNNLKGNKLFISLKCLLNLPDEFLQSQKLWICYENIELLKKYLDKIRKNSFDIEKISSSKIKCKCMVNEDEKLLLFSIPCDKGWSAYVDGKKTPVIKVFNALVAVPVTKGEHTVQLKFVPPGLKIGSVITFLFLLLFIGNIVYQSKNNNTK